MSKRKWIDYYKSLDAHERKHGEIAIQAAKAIEAGIGKSSNKSCSRLRKSAAEKGYEIDNVYTQKQIELDKQSKNIKSIYAVAKLNRNFKTNEFEYYFDESKFDFYQRFQNGKGISKDPVAAARWLLVSYADGDEKAKKLLLKNSRKLKRETAKALQAYLKSTDFYTGKIDGQFGKMSRESLKLWNDEARARQLEKDLLSNKYDE